MKNRLICVVVLAVLFSILLSSCSSVYVMPPEVSTEPNIKVDKSKEYFTVGNLYAKSLNQSGLVYGDYWIYTEVCPYDYQYEQGDITYIGDEIYRIVKMNAKTGVVSSACLDPVCNHSPGSDCLMMLPLDAFTLSLQKIVGDWMVFTYLKKKDNESFTETYLYNLKTGESTRAFEVVREEMSVSRWNSLFSYDDKLYNVKCYLDYTNSGYDPKGNKPMREFTPETTSWLCIYDFETKKYEELFEVPADYQICAVSNMRYFFQSPEDEIYSCDHDGNNFKKEDILDFSPRYLCGSYAYGAVEEGWKIYDVSSDTVRTLLIDDASYASYITDIGVLVCTFTTCEEWMALDEKSFAEAHPEIPLKERTQAWVDELNRIMYSGSAQIWKIDLEGSKRELVFEEEHAFIRIFHATGDYAFAVATYGDPDNDYAVLPRENSGRSVINLNTGEITPIPLLDLVLPE